MKMNKRQYRIGELAKKLNVEKFVIRFWEKEFNIQSYRSEGGQRFYKDKDFETFQLVKTLLYDKKYTIAGAKKELATKQHKALVQTIVPSSKAKPEQPTNSSLIQPLHPSQDFHKLLIDVKEKLTKLKSLL